MVKLTCPFCGTTSTNSGHPFSSVWSLTLHIAGRARVWGEGTKDGEYVLSLLGVPQEELKLMNINVIGEQIKADVAKLLNALQFIEPNTVESEQTKVHAPALHFEDWVCFRYALVFSNLWRVESLLHRMFKHVLTVQYGDDWWLKGFPLEVKRRCLDAAHNEGNRLTPDKYIFLSEFGDLLKANRAPFAATLEALKPTYPDPESAFHRLLAKVNQIRNDIMHPLKGAVPTEDAFQQVNQLKHMVEAMASHLGLDNVQDLDLYFIPESFWDSDSQ